MRQIIAKEHSLFVCEGVHYTVTVIKRVFLENIKKDAPPQTAARIDYESFTKDEDGSFLSRSMRNVCFFHVLTVANVLRLSESSVRLEKCENMVESELQCEKREETVKLIVGQII